MRDCLERPEWDRIAIDWDGMLQDGDFWFEGMLEATLVLILLIIVVQYTRQQRRNAR
jgi:hypothetical protein